ncbi:TetR/AcrR family transcriptional regulator [Martelella lutilitoris]|uniref:TetR/AcrR family transcriptional regulator n=1 Tax=Martelella lutilitoris TaxID=2583532 RepID=A0A5C4JQX7_9HYPH|nr:TetR/AcrR family transcriptional regulator [Martelella lutilitoris]TNB47806.1 TetR/AcrR family transcriptional regulator [Martelella lutilitoris]
MARPRKELQIEIEKAALAATVDLLSTCPVDDISLGRIAKQIGCSAPALYTHFSSKSALLRAVHDEGFKMMLEQKLTTAARHASDPVDRLWEGGLAYLQFAFENPNLYRLMFDPPKETGVSGNPFETDIGARCLTVLIGAVEACQAAGYLPQAEAGKFAFLLWSTVHGAAMLTLLDRAPVPEGEDPRDAAIAAVDALMRFLIATGPQTKPDANA